METITFQREISVWQWRDRQTETDAEKERDRDRETQRDMKRDQDRESHRDWALSSLIHHWAEKDCSDGPVPFSLQSF